MARSLRIEYPGAYYHVINRGNAGENIFLNNRDKEKFLEYLGKATERFSIAIHTYCLMTNHYHLIVETAEANLSRAIQWINVSYATYFNKKRQRSGHLFQGRFKAILVDADEYLVQLSRYIHLNPVRAKIITSVLEYPWSSYPTFIGKRKEPDWLDTGLLAAFGKRKEKAINSYRGFVEEVDPFSLTNPNKEVFEGIILGGQDFVAWVKDKFLSEIKQEKEIPQTKSLKPRISPDIILQVVCMETDCSPEQILLKGKKKNLAREIAIYLTRDISGMSGNELGEYFGGVSGAAITMRYNQFAAKMLKDKKLQRLVNKTKQAIFNF